MTLETISTAKLSSLRARFDHYPRELLKALKSLVRGDKREYYLVGGTLRDWLLDRTPADVDLTVSHGAIDSCRQLISELGAGTLVLLGSEEEDAGRVVWQGLTIDFSSFRQGSRLIEEDLRLRDYTINAMAVSLPVLLDRSLPFRLIGPLQGLADLENNILRILPGAIEADPLRMLRGFRLSAQFGFPMEENTFNEIGRKCELIGRSAAERVSHELDLIMASERAHQVIRMMAETGLLFAVLPELEKGVGMAQPEFHHLDVFSHSLAALESMEQIISSPESYFHSCHDLIRDYLARPGVRQRLKWSALLHDLGKPSTMNIREDKGGRITFYNHDEVGRSLVQKLGRGLRWSNETRENIASLVGMHMHPFHLCNVGRSGDISRRACLKLSKRAGDDLVGLFILAMADSLAGKGEGGPEQMEEELESLLCRVMDVYTRHIEPRLKSRRFLNGNDLISEFGLKPGPQFSEVLDGLLEAEVEGEVIDRDSALQWVRNCLA
ncbi:MAG: HD domain-containing protein [Thermodesulfobacteriota bacterium]